MALAARPDLPLVEVRFSRPWYWLGLRGRADCTARGAEGERWLSVVEHHLHESHLAAGAPPHTGSAGRIAAALVELGTLYPALVADPAAGPPPIARPDAAPMTLHAATARRLAEAVGAAARSAAEAAPAERIDRMVLTSPLLRARSEDELARALDGVVAEAAERPTLRAALQEVPGRLEAEEGVDPAVAQRMARRLRNSLQEQG